VDYLLWKERPASLAVNWWWRCGWRRQRLVLVLATGRKFVVERKKFVMATLDARVTC
jgi:hypothetical protein